MWSKVLMKCLTGRVLAMMSTSLLVKRLVKGNSIEAKAYKGKFH